MANGSTFYDYIVETSTKSSPDLGFNANQKLNAEIIDTGVKEGSNLTFYTKAGGKNPLQVPRSLMNDNVGINYRTIYNGYIEPGKKVNFTAYDDYKKCMEANAFMQEFMKAKRNPTYENIIKYYNNDNYDPHGLSRYKIQDFIFLKYYNQISNNHLITLRRYAQPVPDHMFGLDVAAQTINLINKFPTDFITMATAVTYMGEKTGNKMSEILKFDYGAKWETKTAQVNQLQSSDGGLANQMKQWGLDQDTMSGTGSATDIKGAAMMSVVGAMRGYSVADMQASQHAYPQNAFLTQYGEEFYGDINSICETSMRARGLTFNNTFSLTFEYSLKSLYCVNPRVAMMDILSNFLILTGNYGSFWGGETIYYGARNIGPQFGNPRLLREGKYGQYMNSVADEMRKGFNDFKNRHTKDGNFTLTDAIGEILKGGLQALLGNLLGGNIGVAGEAQAPPALLSGEPTGFWHLTIGNPLDPIAMMGNMKIEKTTVQFNDILGYDDFPTEVKFTVELSHAKPRDNSGIENIFNGNKGRFYVLSRDLTKAFKKNGGLYGFQAASTHGQQEATDGVQTAKRGNNESGEFTTGKLKIIGGMLG